MAGPGGPMHLAATYRLTTTNDPAFRILKQQTAAFRHVCHAMAKLWPTTWSEKLLTNRGGGGTLTGVTAEEVLMFWTIRSFSCIWFIWWCFMVFCPYQLCWYGVKTACDHESSRLISPLVLFGNTKWQASRMQPEVEHSWPGCPVIQ